VALPLIVVEANATTPPDCVRVLKKMAAPAVEAAPGKETLIPLAPIVTCVADAVPTLKIPPASRREAESPEINALPNVSAANATDVPSTANTNQNEPIAEMKNRAHLFFVLSIMKFLLCTRL